MATYFTTTKDIQTAQAFGVGERGIGSFTNIDPEVKLKPRVNSIDIVSDFVWSASPINKGVVSTIPKVFLTEREILMNSVAAGALYYLTGSAGGAGQAVEITEQLETFLSEQVTGKTNDKKPTDLVRKLRNKFKDLAVPGSDKGLLDRRSYLNSYLGIYHTKETGFNYTLPYFGDGLFDTKNQFSSNVQTQSIVSRYADLAIKGIDGISAGFNITQPGTYIERPKHFHFPTDGKSVTVTFPLINTIQKNEKLPYQQNYELLWILTYQNKPYRTSFSRILPPKIYTLTIPGQEFFPYCYISNMKVDFVGNRRNLKVSVPQGGGRSVDVETPIPEAYNVSITFKSLIGDVGNNMISPRFADRIVATTR